jgi:hypothetical protein
MKKAKKTILLVIPILLAAAPLFAFAQDASDTIQLPSDMIPQILAQASSLLGTLGPYMELILGVLLALVVVESIISAIRHRQ